MSDISIIYYTDNSLDPFLFRKCQEYLLKAAEGKRIISVSQKPIDFGDNICIGEKGRSHYNLFYQTLVGVEAATTKYIALAEHDCLYTPEHFNWIPPTDDLFYYNTNHWLVQWGGELSGLYSYFRRKVMSQLICERELYIRAIKEKLVMLEYGAEIRKGQPGACEPGVCDNRQAFINVKKEMESKHKDVGKDTFQAKAFSTKLPNLDIRHSSNFSGGRRANKRRFTLKPWGDFYSVMGVVPPGDWYQEAVINGTKMPTQRTQDTNENRWQNLIAPQIKNPVGTVQDFGCNAGFYCRKFVDMGLKAIGIEKNHVYIRHNRYWEAQDPKGVTLVESDIKDYTPFASEYALLANVHYWIAPKELEKLVAKLREKVAKVIVVSRYNSHRNHASRCDLQYLKELFSGWTMSEPVGSGKHFSVRFGNPDISIREVAGLIPHQQFIESRRFFPSYSELIDLILSGAEFNPQETNYWTYLLWRGFPKPEIVFQDHVNLVKTMQGGIQEPIIIGRIVDGKYNPLRLLDGDHRLIVAHKLGMETIICKTNKED